MKASGSASTLGPREFEQQADGYLYRAEQEFRESQLASAGSKTRQAHFILLAHRDFDRARALYEPITGYSKVSQDLDRLDRDESAEQELQAAREKAEQQARTVRFRRARTTRRWR